MLYRNRGSFAGAALLVFVMLAVFGFYTEAAAQSDCDETRELGKFTLTLDGVSYDVPSGTSTWNYTLDWVEDTDPPIYPVHVTIGVCNEITSSDFLGASPPGATFGFDAASGVYGVKWDPLSGPPPRQLSFTLRGFYGVTSTEFSVGEGEENDRSTICGVSCTEICVVEITCPPDVTVECSEGTDPSVTGSASAIGSCPPFNITYTDETIPGNCAGEYVVVRTWTATDASGTTDTCEQVITVFDESPPRMTCPEDLTLECLEKVPAPSPDDVQASDACGGVTVTHMGDETLGESCSIEIRRTYRATDECGNFVECVQHIYVEDTTAPVITCPQRMQVACIGEVPEPSPETVEAEDNCDGPVTVIHVGDEVEGETCPKTITRTYRATDQCGNSSECEQIIRVTDEKAPDITSCPETISVQCVEDIPDPDPDLVKAKDNCPNVLVRHVEDIYEGACPTTVTRVYEAVDECGNVAECVQTIIVDDTTPPVVECPPGLEVQCRGDVPEPNPGAIVASDNCGSVTVNHSGDVSDGNSCPETITRTYTAVDECGNETVCTQLITVDDTTAPVIECPADLVIECGQEGDYGKATATDNCGTVADLSYSDEELPGQCALDRIILRTWTATDPCGNSASCVQTITIEDSTPPVITCPEDLTLECDELGEVVDFGEATATDVCDPAPVVDFQDEEIPGDCPQEMTIRRTWTATDACGNSASCLQTITIEDTTPPMIACPSETLKVLCGEPLPEPDPGSIEASDNCGEVTVGHVDDVPVEGPAQGGQLVARTYRATDECGNSSECVQMILLEEDTTPPVIECEGMIATVECGQGIPVPPAPFVYDNCDPSPTVTSQVIETPGDCPEVLFVEYIYTATDAAGNSSTATCGMVTVVDAAPPTILCPDTLWVGCTSTVPEPTTSEIFGEDDCGDVFITHVGDETGGDIPANQVYRTYRAIDGCGNTADCTQVIMLLEDTDPPVIDCQPQSIVSQCDIDYIDPPVPSVWDECDPDPQVEVIVDEVRGDCPHDWEITKTVVATDSSGNTATCEYFHIKVEDTAAPEIVCPDTMWLDCGAEIPPADTGLVEADDNCYGEVVITHVGDSTVVGAAPGVIIRTYRATDVCGNSADCAQVIIRDEDGTPPTITACPGDRTYECDEDWDFPSNDWAGFVAVGGAAEDDCSTELEAAYVMSGPEGTCPKVWTLTWTVTDEAGNESEPCDQLINEDDTTDPEITACPTDLEFEGPDAVVYPEDSWTGFVNGGGEADDNCDAELEAHYTMGDPQGECPTVVVLTWTVTDDCENTDTCEQAVVVNCPVVCARWTGGGSIGSGATIPKGASVSHGFEFRCDLRKPNNLQVNWEGNKFHMTELLSAYCVMNPNLPPPDPPEAPANEVFGSGVGRYNNVRGYMVEFHFTDVGEPGYNDYAAITITSPGGEVVLQVEGTLSSRNHQVHPANCKQTTESERGVALGGGSGGPGPEVGREESDGGFTQATEMIPPHFTVLQGVPNPFRHAVKIGFGIPTTGVVKVEVYDVAGRRLAVLLDEEQTPGFHSVVWDGRTARGERVAPGVYFSRVRYNGESDVRKMIVME